MSAANDRSRHYLERELYELVQSDPAIFDFLQSGSMDGIWYWDLEHPEHEWMSPGFWRAFGYDPEEMQHLASEWQEMIHPDDLQAALENLERHKVDPEHRYDQIVRYRHKRGHTVWVRCRGIILRGEDGNPRRMLGAHNDVTELKQAELTQARQSAELRRQEQRYRMLVEGMPLGVLLTDSKLNVRFTNRRLLEVIGAPDDASPESLLGMDAREFPAMRSTAVRRATEACLERGERTALDLSHRTMFGKPIQMRLHLAPAVDSDGERGVYALAEDLGELARSEARVAERNRELEHLLYVISHDLREPLRAISGFARMLEEQAQRAPGGGAGLLPRIRNAAGQMERLIEDVTTLAQARRMERPDHWFPARELVNGALERLAPRILESGASVRVAEDLPSVRAERTWAVEAIANLVGNALKYTRDGAAPEVEILPYRLEGEAGLVVADRGPGVPEGLRERIFDLFRRAAGPEVEGTGAGLAIVRQVAERHGGRAFVRPRAGGGSEFVLSFGAEVPA